MADDMKRTSEYRRMLPFIAKASNDVGDATQGQDVQALIQALNAHKTSADHDGRYYTETEVGTLFTNHNSSGDHDGRYYTETETNTLLGYKADKTITLSAGNGLTGGGTLAANRTFNVGQGFGLSVTADAVAVDLTANFTWTGSHTFVNTLYTGTILPSLADVYDLGDYTKPWRKIWGSELSAVVFSQYEQVLLGGWLTISKGEGKLVAAIASTDTQIDLGASTFDTNDMLVFRSVSSNGTPQMEYMKVGTLVSGTTYNVTRNLDGTGANDWPEGTVFGNWGQTGNGRIELNANDTPRLSVYSHGAAIADFREQIRIGDLNDGWGYSSSIFGGAFGAYESGKANITIDPINGVRIRNYDQDVIKLTGTTASFENFITLGTNGGIRQGTGTWGTNFTGTAMWNNAGIMNIGGWKNGIQQWWGGSDGYFYAGGENLYIGSEGIVFKDTSGYGSKVSWQGYALYEPYAVIEDYTISGLPNFSRSISYLLTAPYATNRSDSIKFGIKRDGAMSGYTFYGLLVSRNNTADLVNMTYVANGQHNFTGRIVANSGLSVSGIKAVSGQTINNDYGNYLHLGAWGVDRTNAGAVLVNTAYMADNADTVDGYHASSFYRSDYTEFVFSFSTPVAEAARNIGNYTFDAPTGAKNVFVRMAAKWTAASDNNFIAGRDSSGGNTTVIVRAFIANMFVDGAGIIPVVSGKCHYSVNGANAASATVKIIGYFR